MSTKARKDLVARVLDLRRSDAVDFERPLREAFIAERASAGLSQKDVSDAMSELGCRWDQTTVSRFEKGKRQPLGLDEAVKLASLFGWSLTEILSGEFDPLVQRTMARLAATRDETTASALALANQLVAVLATGRILRGLDEERLPARSLPSEEA